MQHIAPDSTWKPGDPLYFPPGPQVASERIRDGMGIPMTWTPSAESPAPWSWLRPGPLDDARTAAE